LFLISACKDNATYRKITAIFVQIACTGSPYKWGEYNIC